MNLKPLILLSLVLILFTFVSAKAEMPTSNYEEASEVARQAYIFAFPMLENYRTMVLQAVIPNSFNKFEHLQGLLRPEFGEIVRPNNDTLFSAAWLDLRNEPVIIEIPSICERYFSVQFIDMHTHNFAYAGTRTTGCRKLTVMISGPSSFVEIPNEIDEVFTSEGNFVFCIVRISVNPELEGDINAVSKIQDSFKIRPFGAFRGSETSSAVEPIAFPPFSQEKAESAGFISYLNFLLGQLEIHPSEKALIERFGLIGIGPNLPFNENNLQPEMITAIEKGIEDAMSIILRPSEKLGVTKNGWNLTKRKFGNRQQMQGKYEIRAAAAYVGLYGNDLEEAYYTISYVDADNKAYDGSKYDYKIHFESREIPPIEPGGFWSIAMYGDDQFMVPNPIDRYSIGDRSRLSFNDDGSLDIYIQHDSPGADLESNWLPAPNGPFSLSLRMYLPSPRALDPLYCPPGVEKEKP
ncbi:MULTISPECIES: DUF1254 domain-containing protein [unclassified Mesotoga]|uniref:DUF1254 domain-containing protein n=1 Tax=unclassified Mesotoga TaxID=1184398 RepID=UPI000DA655AF|nr:MULTISPECIES: DUF1254 domain-containing protein [unclassified Mesotoga]PZC51751.1 hypothetical protein LH53_09035 [Mesotoga sp. TolDC]